MVLDKYTLSVFSIIFGIFFKFYDDMNDNKLFKYNKYLKKYKRFINEFLKLLMAGLLTIISFNDFIFCYIFTIFNLSYSFVDISAYSNSYEFSGLICSCILCIYLFFINKNYKTIKINIIYINFIILLFFFISYLVEYILLNNMEFGIHKLIFRIAITILCLIMYFKFSYLNLINNCYLVLISYLFTSCIFQIFLIYNNKKSKKKKSKSLLK
jgi:hypothetical protein